VLAHRDGRGLVGWPASPEEAAAIVAAVERFMRQTAARPSSEDTPDGWRSAALLEGISRDPWTVITDAWLTSTR